MNDKWMNIAGIAIPSLIAILVGYWQIKTMRAIAHPAVSSEKKKTNTHFMDKFRSNKYLKFFIRGVIVVIPCYFLINDLTSPGELTRFEVFSI
ncbi:MAG: hypothetical protein ACHQQQ_05865 [Bacteroidota bacterium]